VAAAGGKIQRDGEGRNFDFCFLLFSLKSD
jgi:hypothetical protein